MTSLASFSKTLKLEFDKWQAMSGEDQLHWESAIGQRYLAAQASNTLQWEVDKWQKNLGEEAPMWHLLGVACGVFFNSFSLGDTFLEASFKGYRPLFLIGFKLQNPILLGPKRSKILFYLVQNKFYTNLYNFYN